MSVLRGRVFVSAFFFLTWPAATCFAQQPPANSTVVHVLGFGDMQRNAKGKLSVEAGALQFAAGKAKTTVPVTSIEDVFTGDDSQRMIGGTLGTFTMFAPYGGGRFLSLFRKKIDVLTVEYRDSENALHGAIFSLPLGQAATVKKQLVSAGAHASLPVEEEQKQKQQAKGKKKEEKKP